MDVRAVKERDSSSRGASLMGSNPIPCTPTCRPVVRTSDFDPSENDQAIRELGFDSQQVYSAFLAQSVVRLFCKQKVMRSIRIEGTLLLLVGTPTGKED